MASLSQQTCFFENPEPQTQVGASQEMRHLFVPIAKIIVFWGVSPCSGQLPSCQLRCVFELAAFLHSQSGRKADLVVYPVSVGPVFLGLYSGT